VRRALPRERGGSNLDAAAQQKRGVCAISRPGAAQAASMGRLNPNDRERHLAQDARTRAASMTLNWTECHPPPGGRRVRLIPAYTVEIMRDLRPNI
jgi:hypothetical protein